MKNEILAKAITGIDDDLIADAHKLPASKVIPFRKWGAVAACLAVIISAAIWFSADNGTAITVFNQKLSSEPVIISQSQDNPDIRTYSQSETIQLAAEIDIDVQGETLISVSSGSMQIVDDGGSILLYDGKSYKTDKNVQIIWNVEANSDTTRFEMTVKSKKETDTVILDYNVQNREWTVSKNTK